MATTPDRPILLSAAYPDGESKPEEEGIEDEAMGEETHAMVSSGDIASLGARNAS